MNQYADTALSEVFDLYVDSRQLADISRKKYREYLEDCFVDWLELPMHAITQPLIQERQKKLARTVSRTAFFNGVRLLGAVIKWADTEPARLEPVSMSSAIVTDREELTLWRAWSDFKNARSLRHHTLRNYEKCITGHLSDWLDLPLYKITKDMIESRHRELTPRGKVIANDVFRRLRSIWRYAQARYENEEGEPVVRTNPIIRLSDVRAWHKVQARRTVIPARKLRAWFEGVLSLQNQTSRDALLLLITTGIRSGELRTLKWSDVDLQAGFFTLSQNKSDRVHQVPLSDFAWNLLRKRYLGRRRDSEYVFPNRHKGNNTGITELHRAAKLVTAHSGIVFAPHDCRRTFLTIGDELEIKSEVLKALVNHATDDVTEGYTVRSIERLRRASQRITDAILFYGGMREGGRRANENQN